MTLTYFMARSAEVPYPKSQVSVYRTIGPVLKQVVYILIASFLKVARHTLLNYVVLFICPQHDVKYAEIISLGLPFRI